MILTSLGPYTIVRKIGDGGMGNVYEAVDARDGRRAALKVLHTHLATESEFLRRFRQEAELARRLRHRNIVPVYEYGVAEDRHYMAMELVRGRSLSDLLRENGRLGVKQALRIVRHVASGLGYAHSQGVIHRDVKPSNILIDSETGVAKLTDFGVARALHGLKHTVVGTQLGTPEYMPIEQALGVAAPESDQYALAVVAYRILAGKLPFTGRTANTLIRKHITDKPNYASDLRDLPRKVWSVLARAMEKERTRRFPTVREFAWELEAAALGRAVPHRRRRSAGRRAQLRAARTRQAARGRWRARTVAGVALVLVIAGVCAAAGFVAGGLIR
jgi:serine/threonine protein kinase